MGAIAQPGQGLPSVDLREADGILAVLVGATASLVFFDWDSLYPYYYVAHIQRQRSDLTFVETKPANDQDAMAESAVAFALDQARTRPVYFTER